MNDDEKLRVEAKQIPDGMLLKLAGDADSAQADELDRELRLLSEIKPPPMRVVIDLSEVGFVASVGIGVLVRFHQELRKSGGKVVLAGLRPLVLDAFRRANLERLFEFHESADEAIKR